jgi:AraC-like DNA-binding protein
MSSYREREPSSPLYPFVACRWERGVPTDDRRDSTLVLPDGCVDLLWRGGEVVVAGPDRTAQDTPLRAGETIRGIRMRPGVAGAVLGMPASELLDLRVPLPDVRGSSSERLSERLREAGSSESVFVLLESAVASMLLQGDRPDPAVRAAALRLGFRGSRVGQLSEALGLSDRQLRRRFHAAVGYGPKTLDRVLRLQRFVKAAQGDDDLARIAADVGYADQAHMTRDCVRLTGMPPARLATLWMS